MWGILILIGIMLLMGIIWALPLYLVGNLVIWLFHLPFELTLFQSFALCLLASVVSSLFKKGE